MKFFATQLTDTSAIVSVQGWERYQVLIKWPKGSDNRQMIDNAKDALRSFFAQAEPLTKKKVC